MTCNRSSAIKLLGSSLPQGTAVISNNWKSFSIGGMLTFVQHGVFSAWATLRHVDSISSAAVNSEPNYITRLTECDFSTWFMGDITLMMPLTPGGARND